MTLRMKLRIKLRMNRQNKHKQMSISNKHKKFKTNNKQVFSPIQAGITRVVISTNIAESSVTIPNVTYVIDFGTVKEMVGF